MADLIDRQAAIKLLSGECVAKYPCSFYVGLAAAADELSKLSPVDSVEVVHGRWIFGNTLGYAWMKCSECLKSQIPNGCMTYCPNCGAKMDGERREENAAD